MKRYLIIAILIFLTASCKQPSDPQPDQVAFTFLTAYFNLDFEQSLPLCGEALKTDLERSAKTIGELSEFAQNKLRNDLSVYSFKIEKVDLNQTKDSAFVSYTVFTPEAPQGVPSHLTLTKEEAAWKVAKLL